MEKLLVPAGGLQQAESQVIAHLLLVPPQLCVICAWRLCPLCVSQNGTLKLLHREAFVPAQQRWLLYA